MKVNSRCFMRSAANTLATPPIKAFSRTLGNPQWADGAVRMQKLYMGEYSKQFIDIIVQWINFADPTKFTGN